MTFLEKAPSIPHGRGWYTPLHLAAESGHLTVVNRLIAAGAALEATDWFGRGPQVSG